MKLSHHEIKMTEGLSVGVITWFISVSGCLGVISIRPLWWNVSVEEGRTGVLPCRLTYDRYDRYVIAWYRGSVHNGSLLVNKTSTGDFFIAEGTNYTDRITLQFSEKLAHDPMSPDTPEYFMAYADLKIDDLSQSDSAHYTCFGTVYTETSLYPIPLTVTVALNVTERKVFSGFPSIPGSVVSLELAFVGTLAMLPVIPALFFLSKAAYIGMPLAPYFTKVTWAIFCLGLYIHLAAMPLLWVNYALTVDGISEGYIKGWGNFLLAAGMTFWVSCIVHCLLKWFKRNGLRLRGRHADHAEVEMRNGTQL